MAHTSRESLFMRLLIASTFSISSAQVSSSSLPPFPVSAGTSLAWNSSNGTFASTGGLSGSGLGTGLPLPTSSLLVSVDSTAEASAPSTALPSSAPSGVAGISGSGTGISSPVPSSIPPGISGPGTGISSSIPSSIPAGVSGPGTGLSSSIPITGTDGTTPIPSSTGAASSIPAISAATNPSGSTAVPASTPLPTTAAVTTTSGGGPPLIVVTTSYDAEASSSSSIDPKITSNTAVTTSDDNHDSGVYPIIKGGSSCFFCPPGLDLGGLVLWGMAVPGIYPPPVPPPFPNFPTMTIGNDIVPTPEPKNDEGPQSTKGDETTSNGPTSSPVSSAVSTSSEPATTSSAESTGSTQMCGMDCSACAQNSGATPTGLSKRVLANPVNGDVSNFVLDRTQEGGLGLQVPLRPGPTAGLSSALARRLATDAFEMFVRGLYGCTSVVVISNQGVYMSHLWEIPAFRPDIEHGGPTDPTSPSFEQDILDALDQGDGTPDMPGIRQYTATGQPFALPEDPVTFIITPRSRLDPRPGNYLYGPEVAQIKTKLRSIVPGAEPRIFDYETKHMPDDQANTATGKILFQYDPVQAFMADPVDSGCQVKQAAAVQMWLEDNPEPLYRDIWLAEPYQQVVAHRKRDIAAAACSLSQYRSTLAPTFAASTVATVGGLTSLPPSAVSGSPTFSTSATNPMISSTVATDSPLPSTTPPSSTPLATSTAPASTSVPPSTSAPLPTTTSAAPPTTTAPAPSPTVAFVDPASTDNPDCAAVPDGHLFDTHEEAVYEATSFFAAQYAQQIIAAEDGPVNETHYLDHGESMDPFDNNAQADDQFVASITSIDGCKSDGYNLGEPLTGLKCEEIMYDCWAKCTGNQGRGGSITAGCLKYSFGTYLFA